MIWLLRTRLLAVSKSKNKEQLREILFIEKCIKLTKAGGKIAILLPDGILNNKKLKYVRDYIKNHTIIEAIVSLPDKSFKASGANSKCSIVFLKKKSKEDDKQTLIYMAIAEKIGFETKTKNAVEIKENDLPLIYKNYKSAKLGIYETSNNIKEKYIELSKYPNPSCFVVKPELVKDRIDVTYFYAEFIYKLNRSFDKLFNIADIVKNNRDLSKFSEEEFKYIQFSNVDTKLGSITGFEKVFGSTAPDRAKQVVKTGDVICARVKDSEENIAIVPSSLDDAIVSTGFVVFRAKPPMTAEALYILLKQQNNLLQVRYKSSGTIMPSISNEDYHKNIVPKLNKAEIKEITVRVKEIEKYREHIRKELNSIILDS